MFVNNITVSVLVFLYVIQSNHFLYAVLVVFFYISPMYELFCHSSVITYVFLLIFLWILYLCLLRYVCVIYSICSLVAIHIGRLFMHISFILFFMQFLPSSLTCIHKSVLTSLCLNYLSHSLKHIYLLIFSKYLI